MRLEQVLSRDDGHEPDDAADLQMDTVSEAARALLPPMTDFEPADARQAEAIGLLEAWNHRMDRERPEPLIFALWLRELNAALYADELGALFADYSGPRARTTEHLLTEATHWCDDVETEDVVEDCAAALSASLTATLDRLSERHGADMAAWRWGDEHQAIFRHRVFGRIPLIAALVDRTVPTDGGHYTLNRGASSGFGGPIDEREFLFPHTHGAGFRAVYDLSDLSQSGFIIATGQSGHPLSRHFDDLIEPWRDGELLTIAGDREALADRAIGTLTLRPAAGATP
jgi:penicillin amidase